MMSLSICVVLLIFAAAKEDEHVCSFGAGTYAVLARIRCCLAGFKLLILSCTAVDGRVVWRRLSQPSVGPLRDSV